jgi:hypothetical protein
MIILFSCALAKICFGDFQKCTAVDFVTWVFLSFGTSQKQTSSYCMKSLLTRCKSCMYSAYPYQCNITSILIVLSHVVTSAKTPPACITTANESVLAP